MQTAWGGVESFWRPYSAGLLHSLSYQIQNLQNGLQRKNLGGEGGLNQMVTSSRKSPYAGYFLSEEIFALSSLSRYYPSTGLIVLGLYRSVPQFCKGS
jgi:hypothetical protein